VSISPLRQLLSAIPQCPIIDKMPGGSVFSALIIRGAAEVPFIEAKELVEDESEMHCETIGEI
jgi:hypothetical protein